jgi:hypothetical protein
MGYILCAGGTWKKRIKWQSAVSSRTVTCLDNVDAFALEATDLEEISTYYYHHMSTVRVQGALRFFICFGSPLFCFPDFIKPLTFYGLP